jgi:hypothetical protein
MVKPAFSEFSYGFALTHELCNTQFGGMQAAPVFPSLIEEGKDGVGYDVHLAKPGAPLFVQFKISQYMMMASAGQWHLFGQPYYRFWLHASGRSSQHRALLKHDRAPNLVLYGAPAVHDIGDLNRAFHDGEVVSSSVFFRPRDIGQQPDAKEHCVAFLPGSGMGYFCSEPRRVELLAAGRGIFEALASSFRHVERIAPTAEYFEALADDVEREVGVDANVAVARFKETQSTIIRARQRAAYAVRTILGAELLWVATA